MARFSNDFANLVSFKDASSDDFRQIRPGSGVPGNGMFSHDANAQSVLAILTTPDLTPSAVSEPEIGVAFVVSSVTAGYAATKLFDPANQNKPSYPLPPEARSDYDRPRSPRRGRMMIAAT